jgi:protein SCO1
MRSLRYILGILIVVVIPLTCYFIVRQLGGTGRVKMPPFYGGYTGINKVKWRGKEIDDTLWHTLPNIKMINQLGDSVDVLNGFKNKIVLMDFFFTTCTTTCPTLNGNLAFLYKRFKKSDSLLALVSISVDPATDSVPALRAYANKLQVNHDRWWFCTAPQAVVKNYMYQQIKLPDLDTSNSSNSSLDHSNKWVLIDKDRNIRGYYNGLDTNEIRRCADDISLLILEKKKGKK